MIKSTTFRPYHARIPPEDPDLLRGWLTRELMAIERALQPQSIQTALASTEAPTPKPPPLWASTIIQIPFTGAPNGTTFTDQKGNALTANGNAITSSATSVPSFGGSSGYFDGGSNTTSVSVTAATTAFGIPLAPAAWCVEGWFNTSQTNQQYTTLVGFQNSAFAAGSWALMINANGASDGLLTFWARDYSASQALITGTQNHADGKWHHAALYTTAMTWCIAVDGFVESAISLQTIANTSTASFTLMFGNYPGFNRGFLGYLQEWRILRFACPYPVVNSSAPTTFDVPTVPFATA